MRPESMGLSITMFSLCAGRARELSSRYVYGNGRNVAWETRNGISRTWSVGEDELKVFRSLRHHPLTPVTVTYENTLDLVRVATTGARPALIIKRNDQFVLGICVGLENASSPGVHWEAWWGRKAVGITTAADTLWCQSWCLTTTPCFCAKV